jgi:hypothetical protein
MFIPLTFKGMEGTSDKLSPGVDPPAVQKKRVEAASDFLSFL